PSPAILTPERFCATRFAAHPACLTCEESEDTAVTTVNRALVRGLPLFQKLSDAELDDILAASVSKRYPVGQPVFEQGQLAEQFFVLLHGRLRVTQVTPEGQQVV